MERGQHPADSQPAGPELDDTTDDQACLLDADFAYGYSRTFASWPHGAATLEHDAFGSELRTEDTGPWAQAESYDTFGAPQQPQQPHRPLPARHQPQRRRWNHTGRNQATRSQLTRNRTHRSCPGSATAASWPSVP